MNALAISIVSATAAGLLAGLAMKPGDALADRPIGPQILISTGNNRVINDDGWYADTQLAGYNGQVPDHVLGADWTQPRTEVAYADPLPQPTPIAAVEDVKIDGSGDFAAPVEVSAPPKLKPHDPVIDGDILGGLHDDSGPEVIHLSAAGDAQAS